MTRAGGCLCGAVRYRATLHDDTIVACHCGMCRRWTGGPLLSTRADQLEVEDPAELATYPSSRWAERGFCKRCGSSLFYRLTTPGPAMGLTFLAVGSLDDQDDLVLTLELFTDKRPAGYCFAGDLRGMTEAEAMAAFS